MKQPKELYHDVDLVQIKEGKFCSLAYLANQISTDILFMSPAVLFEEYGQDTVMGLLKDHYNVTLHEIIDLDDSCYACDRPIEDVDFFVRWCMKHNIPLEL